MTIQRYFNHCFPEGKQRFSNTAVRFPNVISQNPCKYRAFGVKFLAQRTRRRARMLAQGRAGARGLHPVAEVMRLAGGWITISQKNKKTCIGKMVK